MGRRGPAPKPTLLKLVSGNPGRRPLNALEVVPPPGPLPPPDFLDEQSRRVWDSLAPQLASTGLARPIDAGVLARYCVLFVLWIDAVEVVRKHGPVITTRQGGKVVSMKELPHSAVIRRLHQSMLLVEREFGLSPAARTRINAEVDRSAKGDPNEIKRKFFAQAAPPLAG